MLKFFSISFLCVPQSNFWLKTVRNSILILLSWIPDLTVTEIKPAWQLPSVTTSPGVPRSVMNHLLNTNPSESTANFKRGLRKPPTFFPLPGWKQLFGRLRVLKWLSVRSERRSALEMRPDLDYISLGRHGRLRGEDSYDYELTGGETT